MRAGALWSNANEPFDVQFPWTMDNSVEAYTLQEEAKQTLQGLSEDEVRNMDVMLGDHDGFL
jgi:hypothetical protein